MYCADDDDDGGGGDAAADDVAAADDDDDDDDDSDDDDDDDGGGGDLPTFIMSRMVLQAMMTMMMYSNGVETTSCQILYLTEVLFFGMYLQTGLELMTKSMHCFWSRRRSQT